MAKKRKPQMIQRQEQQPPLVKNKAYLDTILSSRAAKQVQVKQFRRKKATQRWIAATLALGFCVSLLVVCVQNGIIEIQFINSAIAATPSTLSLNEYESEFNQFDIELSDNEVVDFPELARPVVNRTVQTHLPPEPEQTPQEVILSTAPVQTAGALEDEDEGTASEEVVPEGAYPTIFVDGRVVCSPRSAEDARWIRQNLLDSYTKPVAGGKLTKRGFANGFKILYDLAEPLETMPKEEAYLKLMDAVQVRLREQIEVTKTIAYKTEYMEDPDMNIGKTKVQQEGKEGISTAVYEVVSVNGVETERNMVGKQVVTKAPVTKVVIKGTKSVATPKPEKLNIPVEAASAVKYEGTRTTNGSQKPGNYKTIPMPDRSYAFSGSNIGSGKYYPNIDTTLSRPGANQGVPGPSKGNLNFIFSVKGSIGSYFGWRYGRMHYGNDTFAATGTPIVASESGTVTSYTGVRNGYGNIVEIRHANGFTTRYAHCDTIGVTEGQKVAQGETIATVGSSGTQTSSPHLHFEIRVNGIPYNPLFYM